MKKIKFFAVAFAALAMFSCSNEGKDGPDVPGLNSPTYVTFTFKNATRVGSVSDTDSGDLEADAKKIEDVRLLIFNAATGALEINEATTLTAGKVTKLVTPGQKKMYVLANTASNSAMNTSLAGLTVGVATLPDFLALTYTAAGTPGQRPGSVAFPSNAASTDFTINGLTHKTATAGFPMSSTDKAATYTFAPNITQAAAEAGSTSATNSFAISLEFMLAKVAVAKGSSYAVTGGTAADLKFAVRNIAQKTYLTEQFAGILVKSYYYTMFDASTTQAQYNANFDYSADAITDVQATVAAITDGAGKYVYAAENTNQTLRVGQATYVAIKANFIPANTKVVGEISWNPLAADGSKLVLGAGVAGTANTTFVVLKKALATGSIPVGTYFATTAAAEKAIALDASAGASTTYSGTPANDYTVYTSGVSWYRINVGDGTGSSTVYGVQRGQQYQIAINRITGPGVNHEDGLITNPENPLSEQTYISATITAKGWSTVTQGSDI